MNGECGRVQRKDIRLRSHCFMPPSTTSPAARVRAAARLVVPLDFGNVVCSAVFVAARAARWSGAATPTPASAAMSNVLECIVYVR